MKRNTSFLFFALIGMVVFFACTSARTATNAQPVKKNIYLQLYSLRSDIAKDFGNTIKQVGEMGFKGIEAASYNKGTFYNMSPEDFRASLQAHGLEPLSSHTGKALADNPSATNWNEVWQWWDQAIAAHKAAGMKYIVTPSMPTPKTLADLKIYCDYYNQVGEKCKQAGLRFGYHNHDFEFKEIEGKTMYDYMLENTDPSKVFFEMDVYWVMRGNKSAVDYFNKYPGRFEILHIKDDKELGASGQVDFDAIFSNTDKAGTKYLMVEVEKYNHAPVESVRMSLEYLLNHKLVKADYTKK
ncbi:sugar phosphate isomerase/epimerase family protein [Haoranjiania flava]